MTCRWLQRNQADAGLRAHRGPDSSPSRRLVLRHRRLQPRPAPTPGRARAGAALGGDVDGRGDSALGLGTQPLRAHGSCRLDRKAFAAPHPARSATRARGRRRPWLAPRAVKGRNHMHLVRARAGVVEGLDLAPARPRSRGASSRAAALRWPPRRTTAGGRQRAMSPRRRRTSEVRPSDAGVLARRIRGRRARRGAAAAAAAPPSCPGGNRPRQRVAQRVGLGARRAKSGVARGARGGAAAELARRVEPGLDDGIDRRSRRGRSRSARALDEAAAGAACLRTARRRRPAPFPPPSARH